MPYQQITVVGNPGQDAEMSYTPSGKAVAKVSIAVNRKWTGTDGQKIEKSTWFRFSFWEKQAEFAANYIKKGKEVMVIGEVEDARAFTDKDGNARASLECTGRQIILLSGGGRSADDSGAHEMATEAQGKKTDNSDIPF